jgi:hypothetical protein
MFFPLAPKLNKVNDMFPCLLSQKAQQYNFMFFRPSKPLENANMSPRLFQNHHGASMYSHSSLPKLQTPISCPPSPLPNPHRNAYVSSLPCSQEFKHRTSMFFYLPNPIYGEHMSLRLFQNHHGALMYSPGSLPKLPTKTETSFCAPCKPSQRQHMSPSRLPKNLGAGPMFQNASCECSCLVHILKLTRTRT